MVSMMIVAAFVTVDSPARDRPAAKDGCAAIRIRMQTCGAQDDHVGQRECMERLAETTNAELNGLETRIRAQVPLWDPKDGGMEMDRKRFGERLTPESLPVGIIGRRSATCGPHVPPAATAPATCGFRAGSSWIASVWPI
jgi:hypothetical protein